MCIICEGARGTTNSMGVIYRPFMPVEPIAATRPSHRSPDMISDSPALHVEKLLCLQLSISGGSFTGTSVQESPQHNAEPAAEFVTPQQGRPRDSDRQARSVTLPWSRRLHFGNYFLVDPLAAKTITSAVSRASFNLERSER